MKKTIAILVSMICCSGQALAQAKSAPAPGPRLECKTTTAASAIGNNVTLTVKRGTDIDKRAVLVSGGCAFNGWKDQQFPIFLASHPSGDSWFCWGKRSQAVQMTGYATYCHVK